MRTIPFDIFSYSRKSGRPLILDGAIGSLLQEEGLLLSETLWSSEAALTDPDILNKVHMDYVSAGADIITANTFRTNPAAFSLSGSSADNLTLVKKNIQIARMASANKPVLVAGSNAPAEDCYSPVRTLDKKTLLDNHTGHISMLIESGADFILNETQSHRDEIEMICSYCSLNNIPFIISLYFTDELRLLSGESVIDTIEHINNFSPLAIGFNCIKPETFERFTAKCSFNFNWGFYLNCGSGDVNDPHITCGIDATTYLNFIRQYIHLKPSFIGACCGSGPAHIKALYNYFSNSERYGLS
ncbi:MAG: homocysteine S-methyltransferase family protein [Syntrophothermus sp.]